MDKSIEDNPVPAFSNVRISVDVVAIFIIEFCSLVAATEALDSKPAVYKIPSAILAMFISGFLFLRLL